MKKSGSNRSNQLVVRRYEGRDREAVIELNYAVLSAAGVLADDQPRDAGVQDIESDYIDSGGEFLVGECDGRIVAMGGIQKTDNNSAKLRRMRVRPDLQRRGFGTAILLRLESRALELGFIRLWLDTNVRLPQALSFYPRHGYSRTHEQKSSVDTLIYFERVLSLPF